MADYLNIAGRVRTTAADGVVAEAQEIKDLLKNKSQQEINADVDNELGDRYTKEETYSKEQLDDLITTPDVNYVSVVATNATTAVTDVLPATGEANTIYRVGNWNGTQYDPTKYALFAWNGTTYVCLAVRSFVGEVYDISVNHPDGQGNPTPYADLTAALGTNGANIPADIRRGGMRIQFIKGTVPSSDNNYVQFRYMSTSTAAADFTNVANWQGVDVESTLGSKNLIQSNGIYYIEEINKQDFRKNIFNINDISIETGYYLMNQGPTSKYANSEFSISSKIAILPDTDYHLSAKNDVFVGNQNVCGYWLDINGNKVGRVFYMDTKQFHSPANAQYIYFSFINSRQEIQLEVGTTRTDYEDYSIKFDKIEKEISDVKEDIEEQFEDYVNLLSIATKYPNKYIKNDDTFGDNNNYDTWVLQVEAGKTYQFSASDYYSCAKFVMSPNGYQTNIESLTPNSSGTLKISYRKGYTKSQVTEGTSPKPYVETNYKKLKEEFIPENKEQLDEYVNLLSIGIAHPNTYINNQQSLIPNENYDTWELSVKAGKTYQFKSSDYDEVAAFVYDTTDHHYMNLSNIEISVSGIMYVSFNKREYSHFQVTEGTSPKPYVETSYKKFKDELIPQRKLTPEQIDEIVDDVNLQYVPTVVLPRTIYALKGEENSIYHKEYTDFYDPNFVYMLKDGGQWHYYESCWRLANNVNSASSISFKLVNRHNQQNVSESITASTALALKTNTSNAIKINIIGDSFTQAGYYPKQIQDMCGNATFVAMRKSPVTNVKCEGRSGYSFYWFLQPHGDSSNGTFSPFMHCNGYNYYGVIEFWNDVVNGPSDVYREGYDDYASWFNTDGRKANPQINDLMFNFTNNYYEKYNGSSWVQVTDTLNFEFNYSEYLRIWNIDVPDFVVILLGTNDFFTMGVEQWGWPQWKGWVDTVINSINACATANNKTIKILMGTVLTVAGLDNSLYDNGNFKRNYNYWYARKKEIETFDTDDYVNNKHLYLVDTGVTVDDKYGFPVNYEKPFAYYEGDERIMVDNNGVHPSEAGYKQIGTCFAAAIQYLR